MDYALMLKKGIQSNEFSLVQVCFRLAKRDIWLDKSILSKMQNGKFPPAKDAVNIALAEILGLDPIQFRLAAVRETISTELIELIKETG